MPAKLNVLIVEDSEDDAALVLRELRRGPWDVTHQRVDTFAAMSAALDKPGWDLIVADYSMPQFSGPAALALAIGRVNDLPFILVSGAVNEETAVSATKAGADDFIAKGNLARLVPAVERELGAAARRRETRRIEQESRNRAAHLANALRLARVGTWHLELGTNTAVWSDEAKRIVGFPGDQPAPGFAGLLAKMGTDDRAWFTELLGQHETRQFSRDFQIVRGDGAFQFVQIRGEIVGGADGAPMEAAGMIQDITGRKRVDDELAQARDAAEAANRSKSEFLANMSHEIRTPMAAILGFANAVVHKDQSRTDCIECARIIQRNAMHLLELINEILDLSKIEAGQMKVEQITCDIPALLSEVVSLMRSRAVEKGLQLGITFQGSIPRTLQTDPTRLRQILVNLIGNAIKFTEAGRIDVRVTDEGAGGAGILLRVDVSDSGIGMTSEQLTRLFQPFTQADESITRKFGGTGLGLTISRRLARLLNGDITVESQVGTGSTFTLKVDGGSSAKVERLENLTGEALLPAVDESVRFIPRLSARVLLVEDGRDNQRLFCMQLGDAGATVIGAENGQIGVELATSQPFDLILMDMQMPVMDGYAATIEMRRRGVNVPIIALTANAMSDDRGKCIASGCSAYLSKPVNEEKLLTTVSELLAGKALPPADNDAKPVDLILPPSANAAGGRRIQSSLAANPRIRKIIPGFVEGLPAEVSKLIDLLARNELASLQRVVHKLRGTCGGYGFDDVTGPASEAEESIKAGEALELIGVQVNVLVDVIRRIEGYEDREPSVITAAAA